MTPGERQYDLELAKSMRTMASWVAARSGKISQTLIAGATRLEALTALVPIDQPQNVQPASTPEAHALEPVRD